MPRAVLAISLGRLLSLAGCEGPIPRGVRRGAHDTPHDIAPGETTVVCASVVAPDHGGRMLLQWDLVQEGVTWFSQALPANAHSQLVAVAPAPVVGTTFLPAMLLFTATLAHFLLVAFWLVRFPAPRLDPDELLFHSVVVGLGTFACALNALAFTAGLSLARGLAALVCLHLGIAAVAFLRGRRSPPVPFPATSEPQISVPRPWPLLSIAGGIVVAAMAIQWAVAAVVSLRVTGADAAHYHVPHAVNIALGANLFGFPATSHLYPMGTSVLAAWFILPFGDALLVDLTILFPFLLAWAAIIKLFREASGESGVTFGPWCVLLLFALPLLRHSLLPWPTGRANGWAPGSCCPASSLSRCSSTS